MKKKIPIIAVLIGAVVIIGIFAYSRHNNSDATSGAIASTTPNGSYADIPSIEAGPDYGKDFKTYTSKLGYSFKYPPYMRVIEDPDAPRVYVVDDVPKDQPFGAIVISAGENDEGMTAEQWLLSENSGYIQNKNQYGDYHKTKLAGQDAVDTEGGMWFLVNTPDGKMRLSITYTAADDATIPFTQMGIVIESFSFAK